MEIHLSCNGASIVILAQKTMKQTKVVLLPKPNFMCTVKTVIYFAKTVSCYDHELAFVYRFDKKRFRNLLHSLHFPFVCGLYINTDTITIKDCKNNSKALILLPGYCSFKDCLLS